METAICIGEIWQANGVDTETIRYYEQAGLLSEPARSANGYRAYGPAHFERLTFIRHYRALDIPLADVKRPMEFVAQPDADCGDIDRLIDAQLVRVQARLRSMQTLERPLASLRSQCGASHVAGECGIFHEMVSAARGDTCACHVGSPFKQVEFVTPAKAPVRGRNV